MQRLTFAFGLSGLLTAGGGALARGVYDAEARLLYRRGPPVLTRERGGASPKLVAALASVAVESGAARR